MTKSSLMKRFMFLMGACVLSYAAVASATQSIDTFDSTTQTVTAVANNVPVCDSSAGADMIAGERDVQVERTAGAGGANSRINDSVPGAFTFNVDSATTANVLVQWDGADGNCSLNATGLGGIDLNPDDGILLQIDNADQSVEIRLRVYTDGTNYSESTYLIPNAITSPQALYFPFADFTSTGTGADFSNVGAIELFAEGTGIDFGIDFVNSELTRDFGDLPSAYDNITLESNNGARHIIDQTIYLGAAIDAEADGQGNATASGDTNDDGITPVTGSNWGDGGGQLNVTAVVPGTEVAGCLVGWIDWNGNGSFDVGGTTGGVSELVINTFVFNGSSVKNITTPTVADYGGTYPSELNARFRLFQRNSALFTTLGLTLDGFSCPSVASSEADMAQLLTGSARNGEVEDYQWGFSPTAVTLSNMAATGNGNTPTLLIILLTFSLLASTAVTLNHRRR